MLVDQMKYVNELYKCKVYANVVTHADGGGSYYLL